jgi:hypothetical protein
MEYSQESPLVALERFVEKREAAFKAAEKVAIGVVKDYVKAALEAAEDFPKEIIPAILNEIVVGYDSFDWGIAGYKTFVRLTPAGTNIIRVVAGALGIDTYSDTTKETPANGCGDGVALGGVWFCTKLHPSIRYRDYPLLVSTPEGKSPVKRIAESTVLWHVLLQEAKATLGKMKHPLPAEA